MSFPLIAWWRREKQGRKMRRRQQRRLREWEAKGRPLPLPDLRKHAVLRDYAENYRLKTMVETGTYRGDTVEAMKETFERIVTIELSPKYYRRARERFAPDPNVELIQGDSGDVLGQVMKTIDQPTLFWLDGHYSGGETAMGECSTPIYKELSHVLQNQEMHHVIVIDDACCFGDSPAYPTIDALKDFVHAKNPDLNIEVKDDMIRITPP